MQHQKSSHMLIVEDDESLVRTLIRWILHYWPRMQIEYIHSYRDAQEKNAEREFDYYLIDMNLPDGFGSDLLPQLPQTSVRIGMSGNSIDSAIQQQFTAFFHKPFKLSSLIAYLPEIESNIIQEIH